MSGFRWISLFLLLLLLTAVTGQTFLSFTVRDGEKVTLPCENVIKDQDKCNSTNWLFIGSGNTTAVELIVEGQIGEKAKSKSDRLSVTANCSLVIKKVTVEDVGRYSCRQFKSGRQRGHTQVDLSVVTMTEHKNNNEVTLNCSVSTYDECRHTVKWLYNGKNLDTNTRTMQASQSTCSATLSLLTSHFIYTSNYKLLKCEVTDLYNEKVQLYNFSPQLSGEKPGEEGKTTTTQPTTMTTNENITESRKRTGVAETTTEPETTTSTTQEGADAITATTATKDATITPQGADATTAKTSTKDATGWWWYIIVAVGLAALLLTVVVVVIRRKKTTGNNIQMDENTADPEDAVSYASISYIKKTNSKARVQDDDDEDDAVTYSTVKFSSSSAGASIDPSSLYATVNKPNK
ncbi:uncharacterized protein LOC121882128 [Thunnus maccoyii]|uniref:uncharacterized protein LOC121882128 n=1 Tax=Thunnus maccoyii TaxID=8240 RepID=UPI001C4C5372|nr:uncharacterized protein LOC121882128 [Thunnus maccoyii]